MKLLIGVMGEKGSGKGTFTKLFKEQVGKSVAVVKSSDVLAETLTLWDIPLTRSNLQNVAIYMDGGFGAGTLSNAVRSRIEKCTEDIVIFEGIRWPTDVALVRSFPNSVLVYITAKPEVRFERMKLRKEKVGEAEMSYEQFLKEEQVKTETDITTLAKQADYTIQNNDDYESYKKKVGEFATLRLKFK